MAAIVCHGLQSCLESQLVESRIHSLRLPSPKPLTPQPIDLPFKSFFLEPNTKPHCEENGYKSNTIHHSNPNQGGWSFLQAVSNVSQSPKDKETTPTPYVLPQVKQSSVRLSPKSLELCTENLGNETGTDDIVENGIDLLSSSLDYCVGGTREQKKSSQLLEAKKAKTKNFPPPLTTIRGSESLRMRPHREGGRLVIEVMKVPPSAYCFQAERSHGRLRLSFLKNPTPSFDSEEEEEEEDDDNEGLDEELGSEMIGQKQDVEEETEETEEEAEVEGVENNEDERDTCCNSWSIGDDMRMEKNESRSRSRSRCKEEGDHENNNELFINWGEPLWVATS